MDARQCCASGVGARALVKRWRGAGGVLAQDRRNDGKVLARRWSGTGEVLAGKVLARCWQCAGK
eukprot:11900646-Alexandrium_andersonii.AAC.1